MRYLCVRHKNECTMGTFFIIDYIVSFFILLAIDAPRWAWFIYAGSALFWFVVWALRGDEANKETTKHENEIP